MDMIFEVKVPQLNDPNCEATINQWFIHQNHFVQQGEVLCEIETDKLNLELPAEVSGKIDILVDEGETVRVGANIAKIITAQ